jgi:hypothetical protein
MLLHRKPFCLIPRFALTETSECTIHHFVDFLPDVIKDTEMFD